MTEKFKFLAGSLPLEQKPHHDQVAQILLRAFSRCEGYLAYKFTTLGRASDEDVPSFMAVTREQGVILIDVVEDRVVDAVQQDSVEYWNLESGETIRARNLVMDVYEGEVQSRLKK